ncbi:hypothetical protein HGRIS_007518 [Hohenbuehelia grisea]|uniref:Uncharacterized protein n=1 Tax=Hohenbuehelia grisea TaxID=104357 RepID=A0ABR3J5I6_9AGAR
MSTIKLNGLRAKCTVDFESCYSGISSAFVKLHKLPVVSGHCTVTICASTSRGTFCYPMTLRLLSHLPNDALLAVDWFICCYERFANPETPEDAWMQSGSCSDLSYISLTALDDVYNILCDPASPRFIGSLPEASVRALLDQHETHSRPVRDSFTAFCRHLLAGFCAACEGLACRDLADECKTQLSRPSVVIMTALHHAASSPSYPLLTLGRICMTLGLSPSATEKPRDSLLAQLQTRIDGMHYFPFKTKLPLFAAILDYQERLPAVALAKIAAAHGLDDQGSSRQLRRAIVAHVSQVGASCMPVLGGRALSADTPSGCLDLVLELLRCQKIQRELDECEDDVGDADAEGMHGESDGSDEVMDGPDDDDESDAGSESGERLCGIVEKYCSPRLLMNRSS